MHYFGTRLSENISRREPEGYLLCLNVPVARTGVQEYLPSELQLPDAAGMVPVVRLPEEVFAPEAIASFEGMPVTDDHPPEGVDLGNIRALQKGHAHHVRRGTGEESDLLLADLIITDPALISAILEDGKREISCGYTYELCEENGQFFQRQIRGNHVAVVDAGRAGPRVCIKDRAAAVDAAGRTTQERSHESMKKSLSKVLARMAKDGDLETVAEIIGEVLDPDGAEPVPAVEEIPEAGPAGEAPETQNVIIDEEGLAGVIERLDRIIGLLTPAAADDDPVEEVSEAIGEMLAAAAQQSEDPVAGELAEVMEEVLDPVISTVLEPSENGGETALSDARNAGDALKTALEVVRPVLSRLSKPQRRKVVRDMAVRYWKNNNRFVTNREVYSTMNGAGGRRQTDSAELGRRIMARRNPSYRK